MMAHLYVDGAATCKSERDAHVIKPYAVQAQRFPTKAHYIALGHLHRPQEIPAPSRTFYAGSILQLDFGEQDQRKRVVVIDAHPRKPAKIDSLELTAGRNLRDVTGTLAQLTAQAADFGDDLLRVTVMSDGPIPGVADLIRELLPNALEVRPGWTSPTQAAAPEISGTDPFELFRRYYSKQTGSEPADQVAKLFKELYEEAVNASD
jgi:exonuclease SbcD